MPSTPSTSTIRDSQVSLGFDTVGSHMLSGAFHFDKELSDDAHAAPRSGSSSIPSSTPSSQRTPSPLRPKLQAPSSLDRLRQPSPSPDGGATWTPPVSITSQARNRVTSWTAAAAALGERPPDSISQNSVSHKLKSLRSGQFPQTTSHSPHSSPAIPPLPSAQPSSSGPASHSPAPQRQSPHAPQGAFAPDSANRLHPLNTDLPHVLSFSKSASPNPRPSAAAILAQTQNATSASTSSALEAPRTAPSDLDGGRAAFEPHGNAFPSPPVPYESDGHSQRMILPPFPGVIESVPLPSSITDDDQSEHRQPTRQRTTTYTSPHMYHRPLTEGRGTREAAGLGITMQPDDRSDLAEPTDKQIEGSHPALFPESSGHTTSPSLGGSSAPSSPHTGDTSKESPKVVVQSLAPAGELKRTSSSRSGDEQETSHARSTSMAKTSTRHLRDRSSRGQSLVVPPMENRLSITTNESRRTSRLSFFGSTFGNDQSGRTSAARKSFTRASVMIRRSIGQLIPALAGGGRGGSTDPPTDTGERLPTTGAPTTTPGGMEMSVAPAGHHRLYAAHMQPRGTFEGALDHPRAQWSEWNISPSGPAARFWHRFSLAVQHEPEWSASTQANALSRANGRRGDVPWLSAEIASQRKFKLGMLAALILLCVIVIAAAVGGSLAARPHSAASSSSSGQATQ